MRITFAIEVLILIVFGLTYKKESMRSKRKILLGIFVFCFIVRAVIPEIQYFINVKKIHWD